MSPVASLFSPSKFQAYVNALSGQIINTWHSKLVISWFPRPLYKTNFFPPERYCVFPHITHPCIQPAHRYCALAEKQKMSPDIPWTIDGIMQPSSHHKKWVPRNYAAFTQIANVPVVTKLVHYSYPRVRARINWCVHHSPVVCIAVRLSFEANFTYYPHPYFTFKHCLLLLWVIHAKIQYILSRQKQKGKRAEVSTGQLVIN